MLGSRSGFQAKVKSKAPNAVGVHCFIHREALASKSLPSGLLTIFTGIVKVVNYVKNSALNTRLFQQLCHDMESEHSSLLFYTSVRWLSAGRFLSRFFSLRQEVEMFLDVQKKCDLLEILKSEHFEFRLAYLVDIFEIFNQLNLRLQGKDSNLLSHFLADGQLSSTLSKEIMDHLSQLDDEFRRYFPDLSPQHAGLAKNPFLCQVDDVLEDAQEEFIELLHDSTAKNVFQSNSLSSFWCSMMESSKISDLAVRVLLPFASTYLCESGFSSLLAIKTKSRNKLSVEDDLRCALAATEPRIHELVAQNNHKSPIEKYKERWVGLVANMLKGKALEVYDRMSVEDLNEYEEFKADILRAYELRPEAYRL
ncbi:protein FAM200A-like [Portunus trituberculatus]|uniref:protein FAM200A-like n=1 Tax=Portunus trituberculatus TaxID=210409 RepID=UPI001E1CCA85|nr:protein FAM200A-like [Portunus trituberculatus]